MNSEVYLNGVLKGTTYYNEPFVLQNIPVGRHYLEIKTVFHESYSRYVNIGVNESTEVKASLARISNSRSSKRTTIPSDQFQTPQEMSDLISNLGKYLRVDKVVLVTEEGGPGSKNVYYQIGDAALGALGASHMMNEGSKEGVKLAALYKDAHGEIKMDVLQKPESSLTSRSVGDIKLIEKRKKKLYKRPLFWILIGAGAASGGIAAAVLGVGGAAAATGGVLIAL